MKRDIYDRLGVKKIINAAGTYTMVGGSRMSGESLQAMGEAAASFVEIRELMERAQNRLAELTHNESTLIVTGAAAGLYILAAACVALKLGREFRYLSPDEIGQCEIIVFRAHRNPYDWSLRQLGVGLREIGYPNEIEPATVSDLVHAITDKTAAIFYTEMKQGWVAKGALDLDQTLGVAQNYDLPVVVDGAAQLPPVDNLWNFNQKGAAATVFSGGKDLAGPQASGLITGSKPLLDIARKTAFPNYGIGRMLKVGREEIAGLFTAVEQYVSRDHAARSEWCRSQIKLLQEGLAKYEFVEVQESFPNEAGQPLARAIISFKDERLRSCQVIKVLYDQNPAIFVLPAPGNAFFINPMTLEPGETEIILERLRFILDDQS